jgi:competence protein ComEC
MKTFRKTIQLSIVLFLLFISISFAADLKVHFIDVGQGDAILIIAQNGKKVLIDAGIHYQKNDKWNPFNYIRTLKNDGQISDLVINYVFITHPHDDHYAGFKYFCGKDHSADDFSIINIYYTVDKPSSWGTFINCLDKLNAKADNYGQVSARGPPALYLGDNVTLTILYPFEKITSPSQDKNKDSLILKLTYNSVSFLFTGDAPSDIENKILKKDLKSNVLKVGHHGSRSASSDAFLKKVKDDSSELYAVISTNYQDGKGKTYGHPHKEALDRLSTLGGVSLYRTDLHGNIIFVTDGNTLSIELTNENVPEDELWKPGKKLSSN